MTSHGQMARFEKGVKILVDKKTLGGLATTDGEEMGLGMFMMGDNGAVVVVKGNGAHTSLFWTLETHTWRS